MVKIRWALAVAVLVLCGGGSGFAEIAGAKVSAESPFTVDVVESGPGDQKLPESAVIAITQTRDGYLWLGTLGGLVRFDGTRFTVFNKANTVGLRNNRIVYLFEDSRGNLWVGTETAGVLVIQPGGQIRHLGIGLGNRERRLKSACENSSGVWLNMVDGSVVRCQGTNVETIGATASAIMAEKSGPVWLALWLVDTNGQRIGQNLMPVTATTNASAFVLGQEQQVRKLDFLLASENGGYWRLADGRVQKWTGANMERDFAYPWSPITPVSCACEDLQGNLIVGTQGEGVFWFDANGRATQISTAEGLSRNSRGIVLSLCLDREGNLWAGTDGGGLNRVKKRLFQVLRDSEDWTVQSVCEDKQGGLWIGTHGDGLKYFHDGSIRQFGSDQSSANFNLTHLSVRSVFVDRSENVLAGTLDFGLCQIVNGLLLQITNSQIANTSVSAVYPDRNGWPWFGAQPAVAAICQDRKERLWFGTTAGLVCRDQSGWKKFTIREGLSSDSVRAISEDARGNLWIGTENGGLNCLSNGHFTAFYKTNGLASETITALLFDHDGALWIGTDGAGLERFQNNTWSTFFRRDGLLSDSICYLLEDARSNLWIGSYAGLARVSLKALNDFAEKKSDFIPCRAFGTSECTQGSQPAACLAHDGRLWFPTKNGVVSVNPAELKPNTNHPPVIIESVLVELEEQNTNEFGSRVQAVTIPPGKERLEIHYTSLNFSSPENVRFKYQLAPHESHWVANNSRVAAYSKLPPGEYQFHVVAFNEDGLENGNGATLAVTVLPAFWQRASFKVVATLGLLGIIGGLIYFFSTQRLQRELAVLKQHEELEKERARIARDLHDQLGANLTQVSLLGELAVADKDLPDEVESHAQQICQTAGETARALDEIVWAINPSNDTLEGLINYACKYAQEYLELAGVSHRFDVPAQLPAAIIAPEVRHNVFLAFKESVNNVVKHAQASSVWVRLRLAPHAFTIEIQDDGRGLSSQPEKPGRNGLRNLRKRMEDVGGNFFIGPAEAHGTVVRLTAPMATR